MTLLGMEFLHPGMLLLVLLLIPVIAWYVVRRHKEPALGVSSTAAFAAVSGGWKVWLRHLLFAMRCAAAVCLIIVIARPVESNSWSKSHVNGTDIVLALDVSGSMMAADLGDKNRLETAKKVAIDFVKGRTSDNMGLVLFAGESFSAVPLTTDRGLLTNYLSAVNSSQISVDGTAVGDGIASAINRIKDGEAVSKSIILITDGTTNSGIVAPETAAEIAQDMGIKVYTIGVGSTDTGKPVKYVDEKGNLLGVAMSDPVDFSALQSIAAKTGGKYFPATSEKVLSQIFDEIDKLEKTEFNVSNFNHVKDDYMKWAWLAFGLFALQLLVKLTIDRSIP